MSTAKHIENNEVLVVTCAIFIVLGLFAMGIGGTYVLLIDLVGNPIPAVLSGKGDTFVRFLEVQRYQIAGAGIMTGFLSAYIMNAALRRISQLEQGNRYS